jgi:hypothetical protein
MSGDRQANVGKWGLAAPHPPIAGKGPKADNPRRSYRSPRAKLNTVGDVSHELGRLYREARAGKLDVSECSKLANVLSIAARIISDSELEARITALEARA